MAVVTPLNNPLGPEGDTVTTDKQLPKYQRPAGPPAHEVRHPYPKACHGAAHQALVTLQGPAPALRRHAFAEILCDQPVLVLCAHAHANQRGFHLSWNEHLYRSVRHRPQLNPSGPTTCVHWRFERSCQLCIRGETSPLLVTCNRTRQGAF